MSRVSGERRVHRHSPPRTRLPSPNRPAPALTLRPLALTLGPRSCLSSCPDPNPNPNPIRTLKPHPRRPRFVYHNWNRAQKDMFQGGAGGGKRSFTINRAWTPGMQVRPPHSPLTANPLTTQH